MCLYLTDKPSYSLFSLLYVHWKPVVSRQAAKQGFIDTDDFFVLSESSAKVTLLAFIMSAALCTVCPRQHGCSQKTWSVPYAVSFLPQCCPLNHAVFLSPLVCVSSWKAELSETFCAKWHLLICSSCRFISADALGLRTCFKSLVLRKSVILLNSKNKSIKNDTAY